MAILFMHDMIIQLVSFLCYERLTVKERSFRIDTHVVMHSKRRITPIDTNEEENYLLQTFEI